jgi:hypothetical protein
MVGTKVQGCEDWFFGIGLCSNRPVFTLTIMDLLLQYVFVVHHLEHGLQHQMLVHTWSLDLDAVERDLHMLAEMFLCKDPGNGEHGGEVQAQGAHLANLEHHDHFNVSGTPTLDQPRTEPVVPSGDG